MRNRYFTLICILLILISVSCDRCLDENGKIIDIDQDNTPDCVDEIITAYSLDELDGRFYSGLCTGVYFFYQAFNGSSRYYHNVGVFTFPLPEYLDNTIDAKLKIYTEYEKPIVNCEGVELNYTIEFRVYPVLATAEDYYQWTECQYIWKNGTCSKPPDCEIMPAQNFSVNPVQLLPEVYFVAQEIEDGWLIVEGQEFLNWIKVNKLTNQISFIVDREFVWDPNNEFCAYPYSNPQVYLEDGGNFGGTGNLPTLEIIYDYNLPQGFPRRPKNLKCSDK